MRLTAVALLVPDYDAAIAFFVGGLGWRLTADEAQGAKRWVTVSDGTMALVLARADGAAQRAAIGAQFGGRVGLFLRTGDFAGDARRIVAAGGALRNGRGLARPLGEPLGPDRAGLREPGRTRNVGRTSSGESP